MKCRLNVILFWIMASSASIALSAQATTTSSANPVYLDTSYSDASYANSSAYSNVPVASSTPLTPNTHTVPNTHIVTTPVFSGHPPTTEPSQVNQRASSLSKTSPLEASRASSMLQTDYSASEHTQQSQTRPQNPVTVSRPIIESISDNNQAGQMASYQLSTLIDPSTQLSIDHVYPMSVPSTLSLTQAQQVLTQVSPKMAANNEAIAASRYQSQASEGLNQPIVMLRAQATRYRLDSDVDLTGLKTGINDAVNNLGSNLIGAASPNVPPPVLPNIPPLISGRIPDDYNIQREGSNVGANLVVLWPVYTAGRTQALTGILDARTDEAEADALMDSDELYTTLIERYFTAQLAIIGAYLREDALHTVEETAYMAKRLNEEGFIADVEYLEAEVAVAEAQSEAIKARHNANLAMTALQRLLRTPYTIKPTTPLFVSSTPLPPLMYFQDIAIANHPGLDKVDANYAQAEQLQQLSQTNFRPSVSVYGLHQIDHDASWLVGVSASWKLWGGLDSRAQIAAGDAQMRQAQLTKIEVSDNIRLLVEKNWQAVDNARVRYLSLNSNVTLAAELLRYRQLGLAEGVNTALDVTTAQTRYLQARVEQAVVANDYVQALAELMESCGTPMAFNDYMMAADIRLPQLY